jgi:hypothetical protein
MAVVAASREVEASLVRAISEKKAAAAAAAVAVVVVGVAEVEATVAAVAVEALEAPEVLVAVATTRYVYSGDSLPLPIY